MPNEFKIRNGLVVEGGSTTITGSLIVTGGITGSLSGTFPFTGSANITGSLDVIGPVNITGSLSVTGGITGSLRAPSGSQVRIDNTSDGNYIRIQNRSINFSRTNGSSEAVGIDGNSDNQLNIYARSGLTLRGGASAVNVMLINDEGGASGNASVLITGTSTGTNSGSLQVRNSANTQVFKTFDGGSVAVGTITTPTARLQVRGSGATLSTTALRIENNNASASLTVLDSGKLILGTEALANQGIAEFGGDLYFSSPTFTGRGQIGLSANNTFVIQDNGTGGNITFGPSNRIFINATSQLILNSATVIAGGSGTGLTFTNVGSQRGFQAALNNFLADNSGNQTGLLFQSTYYNAGAGGTNTGNIIRINNSNINTAIGTYTINHLVIDSPISSSAGTTLVRGYYYNPSISSSIGLTNRAIETTSGDVLFQSGSTPLFFVSQSGNVGIGTTTTTAKLQIRGTGDSSVWITSEDFNAATNTGTVVRLGTSNSTGNSAGTIDVLNSGISSYGNLSLARLGGNVGIGTTSPSVKLQVVGDSGNIIRFEDAGGRAGVLGATGTGTNRMYIGYGAEHLSIFSSGNVGIGITSATARLQVQGSGATESTTALLVQNSSAAASLVVRDDGWVGIGTATPTTQLEVFSGSEGGTIKVSNSIYSSYWTQGNSFTTTLGFSNSGKILWNTNTMDFVGSGVTYRIENGAILTNSVSGSFLAGRLGTLGFQTYGSTTRYNAIGNVYTDNSTSGLALFYKSASVDIEGMRLTSIGNVGIGTNAPAFTLDVNGTARATTLLETSSERYKTNIIPLPNQLDTINKLNPVTFNWKDETKGKDIQYGLIAEEVFKTIPEVVELNENGTAEAISYTKLIPILIKSVQELQQQVNELKGQLKG